MRIALFGASGMVGSRVAKEATDRGLEVTAITRSGTEVPGASRTIQGDMGDAAFAAAVVTDHDIIVSTTGPSRTGGDHGEWLDAVRTIAAASGDKRIFVVGGAGSLLVDGVMLKDSLDFPEMYRAEAETGARALEILRSGDYSPWTLISPAPVIAPGERTGTFTLGLDSPVGDTISAEDFAIAMVDEIENPRHVDARFTVAN